MQIKNLKPKLLFYVANDSQATSPRSALSCDVIAKNTTRTKVQHVKCVSKFCSNSLKTLKYYYPDMSKHRKNITHNYTY